MKKFQLCECGAKQVRLRLVPVGDGLCKPVFECDECGKSRVVGDAFKMPDTSHYFVRRELGDGVMVCEDVESLKIRPTDEELRRAALEERADAARLKALEEAK